jgi:hypothetical protein
MGDLERNSKKTSSFFTPVQYLRDYVIPAWIGMPLDGKGSGTLLFR